MSNSRLVLTDPAEAAVVEKIQVRLARPEEEARWDELIVQHHYLKSARMVGEQLRYVAEYQGQRLALLGWSAASYHLKGREGWIGWNDNQRRARLHLVANNARFCRLGEPGQYPNLASRALALNLACLSQDWQAQYGHPIVWVESFVDWEWFRGTAYKASGWKAIGTTAGFKRVAQDFYEAHDRPKQLFVRELRPHAARSFPPQYQTVDKGHGRIEWRGIEVCEVTPAQMGFPHVAQVARIDRIRELNNGRQEVETVWIITSLTAAQADAARLLEWARQYWSIENGTHYPLDVSAGEDRCRVRHPIAATVLGLLRRAVQGEARAWMRRQPRARDRMCPTFQAKMGRRPGNVIRLITSPA